MGREKIRNEEGSKPKVSRRGKRVKHEQIKEKKRQKTSTATSTAKGKIQKKKKEVKLDVTKKEKKSKSESSPVANSLELPQSKKNEVVTRKRPAPVHVPISYSILDKGAEKDAKKGTKNVTKMKTLATNLIHPKHKQTSFRPQMFTHVTDKNSYILLAQKECIQLLSSDTGRHVATISIPTQYHESAHALCYSQGSVWIGCEGGNLLEYKLDSILNNRNKSDKQDCLSWSFALNELNTNVEKKIQIEHISPPPFSQSTGTNNESNPNSRSLFAIVTTSNKEDGIVTKLVHVEIPSIYSCEETKTNCRVYVLSELMQGGVLSMKSLTNGSILVVQNFAIYIVDRKSKAATKIIVENRFRKNYQKTKGNDPDGDDFTEKISSIAVCPEEKDLAIGFTNGRVRIFYRFFKECQLLEEKIEKEEPKDGQLHLFQHRVLHWHRHPVKALLYPNPNLLLSGGEEAVMVYWQVGSTSTGGGTMYHKPIGTLPRLFRGSGGITYLLPRDNNRVLALSRGENSMKMISTHNKRICWFVGGLAHKESNDINDEYQIHPEDYVDQQSVSLTSISNYGGDKHEPLLQICPITQHPILSGLNGSPGFLHKLSSISTSSSSSDNGNKTSKFGFHAIIDMLEIAPYNRVSRSGIGKNAKKSLIPQASHFAFSEDGKVLVTVDHFLSELDKLGRKIQIKNDSLSETTTLKFWALTSQGANVKGLRMPYKLIAVVSNPHGHGNNISGIALSQNGRRLVTMSSTEGAFRMWAFDSRKSSLRTGTEGEESYRGGWKCQYKIATPSSLFTSLCNISGAMAFNPIDTSEEDESVLAVAYGKIIAFWDVSINREYPILLRHVSHDVTSIKKKNNEDEMIVEKIFFGKAPSGGETIISVSGEGVYSQSIFPGILSSSWRFPSSKSSMKITAVDCIHSTKEIVIASSSQDQEDLSTTIKILDSTNGKEIERIIQKGYERITGLSAAASGNVFYAVGASNTLLSFTRSSQNDGKMMIKSSTEKRRHEGELTVPRLYTSSNFDKDSSKRAKVEVDIDTSNLNDQNVWSKGVESSSLPLLSGAFLRNILGNNLKKATVSSDEEEESDSDDDEKSNNMGSDSDSDDDSDKDDDY